MNSSAQLAKHLRDVYTGGNWTASNLKDNLAGISREQAVQQVYGFNSIAALVYHMNYYVVAVNNVLRGAPLTASDRYSFDGPPINNAADWEILLDKTWKAGEEMAELVAQMPEERLWEDFAENKYGNYYRNLLGIIEHIHYHLGQIALIRKLVVPAAVN